MNASQQTPKDRDVRDYLAAEQTFLAWIRTGLAFMGFGFVVARFGLFLQQLALIETAPKIGHHSISIWFGTVMMLMGVGINAFSAWHHVRLVRQLNQGETQFTQPSTAAIVASIMLAVIGLGMAIYLVSV
jgi:putative membrane protein